MADEIFDKRVGEAVYSENYMGTMGVVRRGRTAEHGIVLFLSTDNRDFDWSRWHEGLSEDTVYVEVRRERGRWSHGWVDRTSRRLVQIG